MSKYLKINVKSNIKEFTKGLTRFQKKQVPFYAAYLVSIGVLITAMQFLHRLCSFGYLYLLVRNAKFNLSFQIY